MVNLLTYKDAKSLVICGDIHGEFVPLVYEMCVRYGMRDIKELLEVPRIVTP